MNAQSNNGVLAAVLSLLLAVATGCPSSGDNPARKEIRPPKQPPHPPRVVNDPIDPDLRAKAREQLNTALNSNDPVLRANAIEALQESAGAEAHDQLVKGLGDEQPLVRFASAMAAGTLRFRDAHGALLELVNDANPSVRVAARYALHRIGDTRYSHDFEKLSLDPERSVRANVALCLGLLGEKSALAILRPMSHDRESLVRLQVAEAMWRLGDQDGLENLVAATVSQAPDDQIIATIALAGPRDKRVSGHVYSMLVSDYPEVSLAAARGMGMLGSDAGYAIALTGSQARDARQKVLAALAFGAIGRSDAQPALRRLLNDSNVNVRVAAATAILQLNPPGSTPVRQPS